VLWISHLQRHCGSPRLGRRRMAAPDIDATLLPELWLSTAPQPGSTRSRYASAIPERRHSKANEPQANLSRLTPPANGCRRGCLTKDALDLPTEADAR
jgi:hypothetical protein